MPIRVKCSCGKELSVRDELAGKAVKCPACQAAVRIPSAGGGAPAKAGSPAKSAAPAKAAQPAKTAAPGKTTAAGKPAAPGKSTAASNSDAATKGGARRPAPRTPAISGLPANTAAATIDGSLDDLFNEAGFHVRTGKTCPNCTATLANDAVLCTQCGLNLATGEKLQGFTSEFEDEQSGEAYLKRAAADMARSKQMQDKMAAGVGMPWWMLGLVLFLLASTAGVGAVAINASRREEAANFDAIATLLMLASIATGVIGVGAMLLVLYRLWLRSRKTEGSGSLNVIKPLILSILAGGVAGGLFAAYSQRMQ
jgi:hypothetical protein